MNEYKLQVATMCRLMWEYPWLQMRSPQGPGSNGLHLALVWLACSGLTDFASATDVAAWGQRSGRLERGY